ncbi:MAG: hypothetical protein LC796_10170, partial [Acidobacteria bacterium]|nr:hypothetical protein [Acidobacteriota bacterium]
SPRRPEPPRVFSITYSGKDRSPAVSPDGRNLAFVSSRDGKSRIWLKQIAGGGEVALTEGPDDAAPRFSADGSSVFFTRWVDRQGSIYRVPTVGGEPRKLVSDGQDADGSPDGSKLVFLRVLARTGFLNTSILVANADGSAEREIAALPKRSLQRPRWTPDGISIAVIESRLQISGPGSILLFSADGRHRRLIATPDGRGALSSVGWSGNRLVYLQSDVPTGGSRTTPGRVLMQSQESGPADLLLHVAYSRLLWSSNRGGHFEIWIADPDGSGARVLTHDGLNAENPSMTPDGQWIIYASGSPERAGLWKIRPDGSSPKLLVRGAVVHPEISPDGRHALFHVPGEAARIVRIEDGLLLPLVIPAQSEFPVAGRSRWMPDGRSIATIGTDPQGLSGVFVQAFSEDLADTSSTRRPLAGFDPDRPTESFGISPDGTRVVLAENEGRSDILLAEGVRGIVSKRTQ